MDVRINQVRYLGWAGKIRVTGALLGCLALILSGVGAGLACGYSLTKATTYPYTVVWRKLVGIDGDSLSVKRPTVPREGEVVMQRLIEYHDLECERWYERKAVSETKVGKDAGYVQRFDTFWEQRLPAELSGRIQTWSSGLSPNFPCGDAFLVENITLSCSWINQWFWKMHKPTIITPFKVSGC